MCFVIQSKVSNTINENVCTDYNKGVKRSISKCLKNNKTMASKKEFL